MSEYYDLSVQQPTYEELLEQFRDANRQRIHARLREDYITFRDKDGNYLRDSNGEIIRRKTCYLTDAPEGHEHQRVDDWLKAGGVLPDFEAQTQAMVEGKEIDVFDIPECKGLDRELRDLNRDAEAMRRHEQVKYKDDK